MRAPRFTARNRVQTVKKIAFLPYCMCRGDHWLPATLPQQRIFWDSLLTRQTGTGEQCSPLQEFFDSLTESTHLSILVAVLGLYLFVTYNLCFFLYSKKQQPATCRLLPNNTYTSSKTDISNLNTPAGSNDASFCLPAAMIKALFSIVSL
mgnify:FL=1